MANLNHTCCSPLRDPAEPAARYVVGLDGSSTLQENTLKRRGGSAPALILRPISSIYINFWVVYIIYLVYIIWVFYDQSDDIVEYRLYVYPRTSTTLG